MKRGWLIIFVVGFAVLTSFGGVANAAASGTVPGSESIKNVTAFGVTVSVPRAWPVVDFRSHPVGCIRLDRHAVYLGQPSSGNCPAHLVGAVAGVQLRGANTLERTAVGAATHVNPFGVWYRGGDAVNSTVTFLLAGGRTVVSVTRGDTRAGHAVMATVRPATAAAAGTRAPSVGQSLPRLSAAARSAASYFTGEGFDTCTAPSAATMQAWLASRYRAVNIYMGGSDRGCAQPNLTAGWVSRVVAQGWTLIPTYVGLQAPCWTGSGSKIDPSNAAAEGVSSADDAADSMAALGLGHSNPVYFDMENYNTGNSGCASAVETFLDSWTAELHSRGYASGVYSSASSGITNLVQETSNPSYHLPDDIWFAHWNGVDSVYGDSYIPDSDWNNHQRIHQYAGGHNETYGGVTLNIDNDAVDAATAPTAAGQGSTPVVRAVATSDGHIQLFWDANGVIKQNWYSPSNGAIGNWVSPGPMQNGAQAAGNPAIVKRAGQQVIDVFTRSTDGQIRETWYNWGNGHWGGWIPISGSTFTGGPQAVATSDGHEQIFADDNGAIKQNWFAPNGGAIGNWIII